MRMLPARALLALTAAGACAAAIIIGAPTARADTPDIDQFLADAHALGWYGKTAGDGDLLRNGYLVCQMLRHGNGLQVARQIYINTGYDVTYDDAANFVVIAANDLCPSTIQTGAPA